MPQVVGVLAPSGRDASVIQDILERAGVRCLACSDAGALRHALDQGEAGAIVVAEEALSPVDLGNLRTFLDAQPPWSDLPVVLLAHRGGLRQDRFASVLGNTTVLERPFSPATLVSAARAALRARARQREAERHILELAQRERELTLERARLEEGEARLRNANDRLGKRFAEALAEKKILADIVEGTDAFVQVADRDYRWLAINRASADEFERIFGIRPEVGASMLETLSALPEHREAVRETWARALAGQEFTTVGEFGAPDRDRRFYEMKFNALRDEGGELIGAYQFVYDVTERLREQEALAEAQARMHEMAKLETLGQLTGGVAHDFNNLLTPITGALDLLHRRHEDDPRSMRLVSGALEAAERAAVLVQRLLTFARRQHLEARAIHVGDLVENMRDLIQRTIGPHVLVAVHVAPDLPAARIDPNQLELAVLNLAVNASDAMPGGGHLTIAVSEDRVAADDIEGLTAGSFIKVEVTDSGVGMDEATLRRAVEPFYTTKGVGKGTGLGLSMVHGLAAQSGGVLRLTSRPGHGTTADIWLPVSGPEADTVAMTGAAPLEAKRPACVLLVDDEELVRRGTAEMLREIGHQVIEASSGAAALELLASRPAIEIVISDYLMPGMRGDELIRQARSIRPDTHALLITGYSRLAAEDVEAARLSKPFRAADLARELDKLLAGESARSCDAPRP